MTSPDNPASQSADSEALMSPEERASRYLHLENDPFYYRELSTNCYLLAAVSALGQLLAQNGSSGTP